MEPFRLTLDVAANGVCLPISSYFRTAGPDLVLFIHGLGCAKESFLGAWSSPDLNGLSLLAPDLPGFGDSPAPSDFACRMEDYAEVLGRILAMVEYRRLHVVAHSMGGAIGLLVAGDAPPPASFINVEGNLLSVDCGLLSRDASQGFPIEFEDLLSLARTSRDIGLAHWVEWAARCDPRAFHDAAVSLVRWSDSGALLRLYRQLAVPKVYVHGDRSALPAVLGALAGTPVAGLSACGHMVMIDQPEALHAIIASMVRMA